MANSSPVQTRNSHAKTPVVIVLVDSNVVPPSQPTNAIPYISPLLTRLREVNHPCRQIYLGSVRYGPVRCSGSHLSDISITPVRVHNEPMKVSASQTITGFSSGLAAFDGYVHALKMFDMFRSQRTPEQNPEEFSYHLWHIAADENVRADCEYAAFLLWGWRWNNIAFELKKRNVKLSVILFKPCSRFSNLFSAISSESTKPWFPTCPSHDLLLSGFDPHHPKTDVVPSTVPAKRPTDNPAEHRSQRLKTDVSSHAIPSTMPCQPSMTYTGPTVSQVTAPDSTTQPPSGEAQCTMGDKPVWSGSLVWRCGELEVDVPVQATYPIRDLRTSKWPTNLRLEIVEAGMSTFDMQTRIQKHKAAVTRFQCVPGTDKQHLGELVKTLREAKRVAVVQLEIEIESKGSSKGALVLVPFHEGLLCALLPASDLPKARLQQPQQEAKLQVDYASPASNPSSFEDVTEYLHGEDLDDRHMPAFVVSGTQVQPITQQSQAYEQGQPQAQQHEHHASLDAEFALAGTLPRCGSEPIIMAENGMDASYGLTRPHIDQWGVSNELCFGGIGMEMIHSHTCEVTQDLQGIILQPFTYEYNLGS